jgi:glyoxylase-like metal-dependent hydrolase (beta-lactamase superfamily II)
VLIDPLAPPEGTPDATTFWKALDADVARAGLPVAVFLGNEYHSRSAKTVVERYAKQPGASVWGHAALRGKSAVEPTRVFRAQETLPAGVRSYPLPGLTRGEVAYFIPDARALVFADAVIGAGSGTLRVCPPSWAEDTERYEKEFRSSIRGLLDLGAGCVIVSHGPSILTEGRRALSDALDAPAWGM